MALTQVSRGLLSTSIVDNGNATAITIDSSENVGIGTASPSAPLHVIGGGTGSVLIDGTDSIRPSTDSSVITISGGNATNSGANYSMFGGSHASLADVHRWRTGGTERMRIDSSGRLSINTTSATELLNIAHTSGNGAGVEFAGNGNTIGSTSAFYGQGSGSDAYVWNRANSTVLFGTNNTERMRITSAGRVGIGLTPTYKLDVLNTTGNVILGRFTSTATSSTEYGPGIFLTNDPNNTTNYLLTGGSPSVNRFIIYSNGNIKNQNNSYTGISDEKLKENIVDAGSQWDDIKALRVRKYSFKEENASEPTQIGVVAQEVEAAGMSGLIYETVDQNTAEDGSIVDTGEVTKTMKYSILYMKAVKALQEAMTRIETLEAKVQQLENN